MIDNRDQVYKFLQDRGIQAGIQFPLGCHRQPAYSSQVSLPNTEYVARSCLSLPIWPLMEEQELAYVVSCLEEYFAS